MKSLSQFLSEAIGRGVVIVFGRFNPPTAGHAILFDVALQTAKAKGFDLRIYTSGTKDSKKNPLSYSQKLRYLKLSFPHLRRTFIDNEAVNNPFEAIKDAVAKGYKQIILIGGSDRLDQYAAFKKYVNHPDPTKSLDIESLDVILSASRTGTNTISATVQRNAAAQGDFKKFFAGCPKGLAIKFAQELFDDVRAGMGIKEAVLSLANLDIPRSEMPQIKQKHVDDFLDYLVDLGVKVEKQRIPISQVKLTQNEIDLEKVASHIQEPNKRKLLRPYIISKDGYLLDGHHKWTATLALGLANKVDVYRANVNMPELLKITKQFPKVTHENI